MRPVLTNLYDLLDVRPSAGADELLRGYKKMAIRFHPGRSTRADAHGAARDSELFDRVGRAYEVLRDPKKRRHYDKTGEERAVGSGPPLNAHELFSEVYGGVKAKGRTKTGDTVVELAVSLEAFYNGRMSKVKVWRQRACRKCAGRGTKEDSNSGRCADCVGKGYLTLTKQLDREHVQQVTAQCPTCAGKGQVTHPYDYCTECKGECRASDQRTLTLHVEKGMCEGDHFTFQGEGDEDPGKQLPGDLVIFLTENKHEVFNRRNNHLLMSHELTLVESLTGFHLVVNHLDGRQLVIQPPRGVVVSPNQLWQVDNEGMPFPDDQSRHGHLIICFSVLFPERLPANITNHLSLLLGAPRPPLLDEGFEARTLTLADRSVFTEQDNPTKKQSEEYTPGIRTATCSHQ
ncbi:DnaJ protein-like protein [Diplonema papillatum]|nr:DnaJ protein-like protein [Diplonema papillatum]